MNWQQALQSGDLDALKSLGDIWNLVDENTQERPLHFAAKSGKSSSVGYLLEKKTPLDEKDKFGRTPLYMAVFYRHLEIVKLLLQQNMTTELEINACCTCGTTMVSKAAENGDIEILRLLLEKGAVWNTTNHDDETPIELAQRNGHGDAGMLIQKYERQCLRKFITAAKNGGIDTMRNLIANNSVDPAAPGITGEPALHLAVFKGREDVVRFLLNDSAISKKAVARMVQARDRRKKTALGLAREKKAQSTIIKLLENAEAQHIPKNNAPNGI